MNVNRMAVPILVIYWIADRIRSLYTADWTRKCRCSLWWLRRYLWIASFIDSAIKYRSISVSVFPACPHKFRLRHYVAIIW